MRVVNLAHRFGIKKRRLLGSVWDGSALDETSWRVLKPWWFPDSQMGIWSEQFIGDLTMLEPGEICQGRWLAYPCLQPSRGKSNEKDMYVFSDYYWLLLLLIIIISSSSIYIIIVIIIIVIIVIIIIVIIIIIYIYDVSWTRLPALAEVPWAHPRTAKSPLAEPVAPGSEESPMESTACSGCRRSVSCQWRWGLNPVLKTYILWSSNRARGESTRNGGF